MAANVALPGGPSLLIYKLTLQSETINFWASGLVPGLIGEAYRKSHERFLAALQSVAGQDKETLALMRPFACMSIEPLTSPCRRIAATTAHSRAKSEARELARTSGWAVRTLVSLRS